MLKGKLIKNEEVKPNTREMEILKNNFPHFFDENGSFLIDKFHQMLKTEEIKIQKEGYELKFLGKSYARYITSTETETVIVPDITHNKEEINNKSENLYIVGDNLDGLKHLLKSYSNKVKCIYIDPPYNTGSDGFVYPDNYQFTPEIMSEKMGIDIEEATRIIDMRGKSTHSAWLTFIYPRLVLARELLSDDGVIFISIDDNEQANLKMICDEIFGEENLLANLIWKRKRGRDNSAKWFSRAHEYCLVYAKNKDLFNIGVLKLDELTKKAYKNPDNDPRGDYRMLGCWARGTQGGVRYDFETKEGMHFEERLWLFSKENLKKLDEENKLIIRGNNIYRKMFIFENKGKIPETLWDDVSNAANASDEIKRIFDSIVFETPKPIPYIKRMIEISTKNDDIILDFFSGSSTTAHAVMQLNAEDGGDRKYIMVQLPEKTYKEKVDNKGNIKIEETQAYKEGYKTIDEIGRERIKRAANKIKEETSANIDYGFKLFRLETPNANTLDKIVDFEPENEKILITDNFINEFKFGKTEGLDTIITTWLNEDGYGLNAKVSEVLLENYKILVYKESGYIIEEGITTEDVMALINKIESNELQIDKIVIYPYSIPFSILQEMKLNFKNLKNNKTVRLIERY